MTTPLNNTDSNRLTLGPLLAQHENALLLVLLRSDAADHAILRCVNRQFRDTIDSTEFRRERAIQEFAQVEARLWTRDELLEYERKIAGDKNDTMPDESEFISLGRIYERGLDLLTNRIKITVDGRKAGEGKVAFIRCGTTRFYDSCNVHSSDLLYVGTTLCNKNGRPTMPSIDRVAPFRPGHFFMYIDKFSLHEEYRRHTWVGAQAVRSFMTKDRLIDKWNVCIYLANNTEQSLKDEDIGRMHISEKEWRKELLEMDMRQFLRAGFRQGPEAVLKASLSGHIFCVPDFLRKPMPTHPETMAMSLIQKPPPPSKAPSGVHKKMLDDVVKASCAIQSESRLYRLKIDIQRRLNEGATIWDSNACHACSANADLQALQAVLEFVAKPERIAVLNKRDENGMTPLMFAAEAAASRRLRDTTMARSCIVFLLDSGADKNVTNLAGRTALGAFRHACKALLQFEIMNDMNIPEDGAEITRRRGELDDLLEPSGGATDADDAVLIAMASDQQDGLEADLVVHQFEHFFMMMVHRMIELEEPESDDDAAM